MSRQATVRDKPAGRLFGSPYVLAQLVAGALKQVFAAPVAEVIVIEHSRCATDTGPTAANVKRASLPRQRGSAAALSGISKAP